MPEVNFNSEISFWFQCFWFFQRLSDQSGYWYYRFFSLLYAVRILVFCNILLVKPALQNRGFLQALRFAFGLFGKNRQAIF